MECYSCLANTDIKAISPGSRIFEGDHWIIEHNFPTRIKGWLVIVAKKHTEALHELSLEEFTELTSLIRKTAIVLKKEFDCPKEYIGCFSEAEHFNHTHLHIIAKPKNLSKSISGPRIFTKLRRKFISDVEIKNVCLLLKERFIREEDQYNDR